VKLESDSFVIFNDNDVIVVWSDGEEFLVLVGNLGEQCSLIRHHTGFDEDFDTEYFTTLSPEHRHHPPSKSIP
jgi:hypothetical protein